MFCRHPYKDFNVEAIKEILTSCHNIIVIIIITNEEKVTRNNEKYERGVR